MGANDEKVVNIGRLNKFKKCMAKGGSNRGIFIDSNGNPQMMAHTLGADVPSNANFDEATFMDKGMMSSVDKRLLEGSCFIGNTTGVINISDYGTTHIVSNIDLVGVASYFFKGVRHVIIGSPTVDSHRLTLHNGAEVERSDSNGTNWILTTIDGKDIDVTIPAVGHGFVELVFIPVDDSNRLFVVCHAETAKAKFVEWDNVAMDAARVHLSYPGDSLVVDGIYKDQFIFLSAVVDNVKLVNFEKGDSCKVRLAGMTDIQFVISANDAQLDGFAMSEAVYDENGTMVSEKRIPYVTPDGQSLTVNVPKGMLKGTYDQETETVISSIGSLYNGYAELEFTRIDDVVFVKQTVTPAVQSE